jgi:hypothetical protein
VLLVWIGIGWWIDRLLGVSDAGFLVYVAVLLAYWWWKRWL